MVTPNRTPGYPTAWRAPRCHRGAMTRTLDADYLVVGAGAMGMAFTDALIDHSDARVVMVDRRHGVGGHWLEAYPFVRLHQSSCVLRRRLHAARRRPLQDERPGGGAAGARHPAGDRAPTTRRCSTGWCRPGRLEFHPNSDFDGDRTIVSRISGERFEVPESCRIVNAHYLSPDIPAEAPPPFAVADGARVLPVNDLGRLEEAPSQYVVVGSGKTATDACIWLLGRGVDPDAICWVRPRDPWMLNRARVQPDPAIFLGLVADIMQSAAESSSLDDIFLRLEDAGAMLRIDRSVTPTMAKAPTLGDLGARRSCGRSSTSYAAGTSSSVSARPARAGRGVGVDRRRRARGALRGRRPQDPAAGAGLATRGHHAAADPGRLPLLRRRAGGLRRGHPRPTTTRRTGSARRRTSATRCRSGPR